MKKRARIFTLVLAAVMAITAVLPGFAANIQPAHETEAEAVTTRLSDNTSIVKRDLVIVTGSAVNFRSKPSTASNSTVYYKLRLGSTLLLKGESGNYYKAYDACTGKTGYISKDYSDDVYDYARGHGLGYVYIAGNNVNVRQTPRTTTSTPVVCTLQKGALVKCSPRIWYNYGLYWFEVKGGYLAFAWAQTPNKDNWKRKDSPQLYDHIYELYDYDLTHNDANGSTYVTTIARYWN